jgi:molybdopterin converting factor small subunit
MESQMETMMCNDIKIAIQLLSENNIRLTKDIEKLEEKLKSEKANMDTLKSWLEKKFEKLEQKFDNYICKNDFSSVHQNEHTENFNKKVKFIQALQGVFYIAITLLTIYFMFNK